MSAEGFLGFQTQLLQQCRSSVGSIILHNIHKPLHILGKLLTVLGCLLGNIVQNFIDLGVVCNPSRKHLHHLAYYLAYYLPLLYTISIKKQSKKHTANI